MSMQFLIVIFLIASIRLAFVKVPPECRDVSVMSTGGCFNDSDIYSCTHQGYTGDCRIYTRMS
jgi:hypothetical protein